MSVSRTYTWVLSAVASVVVGCQDDIAPMARDAGPDVPLCEQEPDVQACQHRECTAESDCDAGACVDGRCLLATGVECTSRDQCESGRCEWVGPQRRCTQPCLTVCPHPNLACFNNLCVPASYCDNEYGDGYGDGPGCVGTPCDTCHANATCRQVELHFVCTCNPGFEGDGHTCTDINECSIPYTPCDFQQACQVTPQGIVCECPDTGARCHEEARCTNTDGAYACACRSGFEGDGVLCTDIDECATGADNCAEHAFCANTPGGFQCQCEVGFSGNGRTCTDIDECASGTHRCDPRATCTNEQGGYACICGGGYEGDGRTCTDTNECLRNDVDCSPNALCINLPGSYTCTCAPGYRGDGKTCVDINECVEGSHACDPNAACQNIPGFYACTCAGGFTGNGFSCTDIDECANGTHTCSDQSACQNLPGTYQCL